MAGLPTRLKAVARSAFARGREAESSYAPSASVALRRVTEEEDVCQFFLC